MFLVANRYGLLATTRDLLCQPRTFRGCGKTLVVEGYGLQPVRI